MPGDDRGGAMRAAPAQARGTPPGTRWRQALSGLRTRLARERCPVCGVRLQLDCQPVICDELAADWKLSGADRAYFEYREGCLCAACGASLRSRAMAGAIVEVLQARERTTAKCLDELARHPLPEVAAAEINACGNLHPFLSRAVSLSYSEYGSRDPRIPSENLMSLSYRDGAFDLVLNSDVLEHVPDYRQALREIARVTKPQGHFIFTVPLLMARRTRTRARLDGAGRQVDLDSRSYHGRYDERRPDHLVFHEFGGDLLAELAASFRTEIRRSPWPWEAHPAVFICTRKDGA